jgi:Transcriptional Coactivator p15 (PC4)
MPQRECPIAETVMISQFWRNRRGEAIVTSFEPYEGHVIVHVRQYYTTTDGKLAPTAKGIAINITRLPDLVSAVAKAHAKAIELGLIDGAEQ